MEKDWERLYLQCKLVAQTQIQFCSFHCKINAYLHICLYFVDSAESVDNILVNYLKIKKYNIKLLDVMLHCRSKHMDT